MTCLHVAYEVGFDLCTVQGTMLDMRFELSRPASVAFQPTSVCIERSFLHFLTWISSQNQHLIISRATGTSTLLDRLVQFMFERSRNIVKPTSSTCDPKVLDHIIRFPSTAQCFQLCNKSSPLSLVRCRQCLLGHHLVLGFDRFPQDSFGEHRLLLNKPLERLRQAF
jgi:hypothetical protein